MTDRSKFLKTHLALAIVLLMTNGVHAADQLLLGKKLLIKNPPSGPTSNKVVHLGKDASIAIGAAGSTGDPQCSGDSGGGGSLRVVPAGGGPEMNVALPCENWTTNATNTLYKYNDPTGATCKLVMVKSGVLVKAVCKGASVALDVDGAMAPVAVVTTLNTQQYCTEFGGTLVKDGADSVTFLGKDSAAPASCSTMTPTTSTTSTTVPCGGSSFNTFGGSCAGGVACSFSFATQSCFCPTTTQCQNDAYLCIATFGCGTCGSCPAGYSCNNLGPLAACGGFNAWECTAACGSDCSCPAGGNCRVF